MSKNDNLERLNQISSTVSERDKKIWENVAHSTAIRKKTEYLKAETARLKAATAEREKQIKELEEGLVTLTEALSIQSTTLESSEESALMQKTLKESLYQESNDFKNKYAETLVMFNDELREYRAIFEKASKGYNDLRAQEITVRKLEIQKMDLETKTLMLERSQKLYLDIQKKTFQKTIVRFAEYYTLYHEGKRLELLVRDKKKEEQELLKEHLQLSELLKQKTRMKQSRPRPSINEDQRSLQYDERPKESEDKLRKFLDEEIQPCSLTTFNSSQRALSYNQDHSKVTVLDVKVIKPLPPRPIPSTVKKPDPELRKKMETIMQTAKKNALRTNSFMISPLCSQEQQEQQSKPNAQTPQVDSQQSRQNVVVAPQQTKLTFGSQSSIRSQHTPVATFQTPQIKPGVVFGSQQSIATDMASAVPNEAKKIANIPSLREEKQLTPKETGTGSILKPPNQAVEKGDANKQENVSKFFNSKKKSVTFQTESVKDASQGIVKQFQLFGGEESKQVEAAKHGDFDMFPKSFFKNDAALKQDRSKQGCGLITPESATTPNDSTNNISFTTETGPTFSTFGAETSDKKTAEEVTFDLMEVSFGRGLAQSPLKPAENFAQPSGGTTFNFFGSQSQKKTNPFSMF